MPQISNVLKLNFCEKMLDFSGKDVPWEKFLISLFHDENGNWELDMNEQGIPVEGYAREKCKKEADASATVKMKMYYPVND